MRKILIALVVAALTACVSSDDDVVAREPPPGPINPPPECADQPAATILVETADTCYLFECQTWAVFRCDE